MTNEQKATRIHELNLAIRVLNRKIVNLQYQLAQFADCAVMIATADIETLLTNRNVIDGLSYAATQVIEGEHNESKY